MITKPFLCVCLGRLTNRIFGLPHLKLGMFKNMHDYTLAMTVAAPFSVFRFPFLCYSPFRIQK